MEVHGTLSLRAGTLLCLTLLWAGPTFAADYEVTFEAFWNAADHPTGFPPSAHFSSLIGPSHNANDSYWVVGEAASPEIVEVAENGNRTPLSNLIDASPNVMDKIVAPGIFSPGATAALAFSVDSNHPLVSLGGMTIPVGKISTEEQQFFVRMSTLLNTVLQETAASKGVHWVDPRPAFINRLLCDPSGSPWIFPMEQLLSPVLEWSAHPTNRGQIAYANVINAYLQAQKAAGSVALGTLFENGLPTNPLPGVPLVPLSTQGQTLQPLASVASLLTPDLEIVIDNPVSCPASPEARIADAGAPVTIISTGDAYQPGSTVALDIRLWLPSALGEESIVAASLNATADANGNLNRSYVLPTMIPGEDVMALGVSAVGTGAGGESAMSGSLPVAIVADASSDDDGDGIALACDLCPDDADATNGDRDGDGIGDICDTCPDDSMNDIDRDGICGDVDPDPDNPPNPTPTPCGFGPEVAAVLPLLYFARRWRQRRR